MIYYPFYFSWEILADTPEIKKNLGKKFKLLFHVLLSFLV